LPEPFEHKHPYPRPVRAGVEGISSELKQSYAGLRNARFAQRTKSGSGMTQNGMENLSAISSKRLERFVTPQWYFQYARPAIRK
jgi:hypothetical protein